MAYTKTNWENLPSTNTPVNATNLNKIETGIVPANTQLISSGSINLNDYKTDGLYHFTGATLTNAPAGVNGWLRVMAGVGGATKQIWFRHGTPGVNDFQTFVRTYSGTWGGWKRLLTSEEEYYQAGDTVTVKSGVICPGDITGGAKDLRFQIPVDKKLTNITAINFTSLNITIRGINGYLADSAGGLQIVNNSDFSFFNKIVTSEHTIYVDIQKTAAISVTNNTPITVYINSCTMTLS